MASGDAALWLHNKLGSTDDLWSGKTICSQLSKEKLLSIRGCFFTLQPHVKVKVMLSFLHLPRRNVEEVCVLYRFFINLCRSFTNCTNNAVFLIKQYILADYKINYYGLWMNHIYFLSWFSFTNPQI